jgi:chromate transporter
LLKKTDRPTCPALFVQTFIISSFTIGGGYVMIPLLRERFAEKLKWFDRDELDELTAIGQSAPGAMIINTSILAGYRLLGFKGAVSALLGTVLPPLIVVSAVSYFYDIIRSSGYVSAAFRGMGAGVSAVVADAALDMARPYIKKGGAPYILIMALAFTAAFFFSVNVALIIAVCGLLGAVSGALGLLGRKDG